MLVFLGIKSLRTRKTLTDLESAEQKVELRIKKKFGLHGPFLLGVLLYLANPTFLPYWLGVSGLLQRYGLLIPNSTNFFLFSIGVGVGSALWFYLILVFLLKRAVALTPAIINGIYRFSGVTLLGFGSYLGYRLVTVTNWTPLLALFSFAR
jgi:threonine/homoserine/homoserine lactone efflux protein